VRLEPALGASPEAAAAAAARLQRFAHLLPSFVAAYPLPTVAHMLSGDPRLLERLREAPARPGILPPAVLAYLADARPPAEVGVVGDCTVTDEELDWSTNWRLRARAAEEGLGDLVQEGDEELEAEEEEKVQEVGQRQRNARAKSSMRPPRGSPPLKKTGSQGKRRSSR